MSKMGMEYLELIEKVKRSVAVDKEKYTEDMLKEIQERYCGFWHEEELLIPHNQVACIEFRYDNGEYAVLKMRDGRNIITY